MDLEITDKLISPECRTKMFFPHTKFLVQLAILKISSHLLFGYSIVLAFRTRKTNSNVTDKVEFFCAIIQLSFTKVTLHDSGCQLIDDTIIKY